MNIIERIINAIKRLFGFDDDVKEVVKLDGNLNLVLEEEVVITKEEEVPQNKAKKVTKKKNSKKKANKKKASKKKSSKKKKEK